MRRAPWLALLLTAALVPAAPAFAAWPIDPYTAPHLNSAGRPGGAIPDGTGGAYIASEAYGVNPQIRVYRINSDGTYPSGWTADGVIVADLAGARQGPVIATDGSGGVFVAWEDSRNVGFLQDIYVQHVLANGTIAPGWAVNGVRADSEVKGDEFPVLARDGSGGVVVAWSLQFGNRVGGTDYDLYAARIGSAGTVLWEHVIKGSAEFESPDGCVYVPSRGDVAIVYGYRVVSSAGGNYDIKLTDVGISTGVSDFDQDICTAAGDQYPYQTVTGVAEQWYLVWRDGRTGNYPAYAKFFDGGSASFSGTWPIGDGKPVAPDGYYQSSVVAAVDASGALWTAITTGGFTGTGDIIVQRTGSNGLPSPGWPATGLYACSAAADQAVMGIDIDGAQDAVVEWTDRRGGSPNENDIYVTRFKPDGTIATGYVFNGTPVALEPGAQQSPGFVIGDPQGGAIVTWFDGGTALAHVDRFGALGDVSPKITSVRDVAADQGGHVRLQWSAAPYDVEPAASIDSYWIWRSTPLTLAQQAVARGAGRWLGEGATATGAAALAPAAGGRLFLPAPDAASGFAWEYVASQPASLLPAYSYVAATVNDSGPGGPRNTAYMVQARSTTAGVFWSSAPDSGHSVDNLAPNAPVPFTGTYASGTSSLAWGAPSDPDVGTYRLYRGSSAGFVPGPASFVTETAALTANDTAGQPYWYKVAAVDVHGNVGAFATVLPSGTLDAGGETLPSTFAFAPQSALPWRGGSLAMRCDLPRASHVTVVAYDVGGRVVARLADADRPAGRHTIAWDGRGADGAPVRDGLYLLRLSAGTFRATQRVVLAR